MDSNFYIIFLPGIVTLIFFILQIKLKKEITWDSLGLIAFALILFLFVVALLYSYTQHSDPPLPNGVDFESKDIKAALNNMGMALYMQNNYTGAIKYYDTAIEIDPEYVLAWSNKGNALMALNRKAEAEKAFERAQEEL